MLNILPELSHLIPMAALRHRYCYYHPHFTEKETEGVVTYPDCQRSSLDLSSRPFASRARILKALCYATVTSLYIFPSPDPEIPEGGVLHDSSIFLAHRTSPGTRELTLC